MNDGIYFEVFAVKDGVRYNMKIINSINVSTILINSIMDGIEKIVTPEEVTEDKEVKVLKHKVVRVDNLMYNGCEPHWKCTRCGKCVPFHCYTKEQFESQDCKPSSTDDSNRKRD